MCISTGTFGLRNMLQGPWKEANASVLTLHVDDRNVNGEAMEIALAYLYGHYPKLNDDNAFRVLAAASFLDLQVDSGNYKLSLYFFFLPFLSSVVVLLVVNLQLYSLY